MFGSFEKRMKVKPRRVIDASVIIGSSVKDNCAKYLSKLSYEHHGFVTHALLGEVALGICLHVPGMHLKREHFQYLEELILEDRLQTLPIVKVDPGIMDELIQHLPFLTLDDAFHLAELSAHGFKEFVTIDSELTSRLNRRRLSELGIRIVMP